MAEKDIRQTALRAILEEYGRSTHEEIKALLNSRGISASQSTLSRDLREMGAVKIPVERGGARYVLGGGERGGLVLGEIGRAMRALTVEYERVGNMLIIKTTPGNAPAFCVVLDHQRWPEIVGTIAGDDTILVIARTESDIALVVDKLNTSVEEGIA